MLLCSQSKKKFYYITPKSNHCCLYYSISLSLKKSFFPLSKNKLCLGFCIEFINPKQKNLKRWSLFTHIITLYIYKRINHRALRILSTPLRESKTRSAREKKKKKKKKTTVCRVDAPKHLIKLFFF